MHLRKLREAHPKIDRNEFRRFAGRLSRRRCPALTSEILSNKVCLPGLLALQISGSISKGGHSADIYIRAVGNVRLRIWLCQALVDSLKPKKTERVPAND